MRDYWGTGETGIFLHTYTLLVQPEEGDRGFETGE